MKHKVVCIVLFGLLCAGCFESKTQDTYYTQLLNLLTKLEHISDPAQLESLKSTYTQDIIDDALALRGRASSGGYTLISPNDLKQNLEEYIIISTMPRGIYNMGLIPNAKHFEFALSPSLYENGKEWNWEADALGRNMKDFVNLLGTDKGAKIVFYDSGEHILSPAGSAHLGILWARHLGYTHLYRLVGGLNAWKELSLPISTQAPKCCQM